MLKGNLSSRPFYNDRVVTVVIGVLAALVLAATLFNIVRLYTLVTERAEIRARLDADTAEAARVRAEADTLQRGVDRVTLARLAASAREANTLIERRTFSWTRLLEHLEDTLPAGVRLTTISPRLDSGEFRVAMAVVARSLDDIDEFVESLLATGRFYDVAAVEQRANDDGSYQAVVQVRYLTPRPGGNAAVLP